jgi:glutathione S-transferase
LHHLNHPIFTRWPAQHPDRLQLFSLPTPNGVMIGFYEARELVGFDRFLHVQAWLDRCLARPACSAG